LQYNYLTKRKMKIIDIGINLMYRSLNEDREQMVQATIEAGVNPLRITGTRERSSMYAAKIRNLEKLAKQD